MSSFEEQLNALLERANEIKSPKQVDSFDTVNLFGNRHILDDWMNDVEIFHQKFLTKHALSSRIQFLLLDRGLSSFPQLVSCLRSVAKDKNFTDEMNGISKKTVPSYQAKNLPQYDVFLSHANKDKEDFVEDLYKSLEKLGVNIFYDRKSLEWGDKWKERILEGTKKSEFAIIVISQNFFGREWTEKELNEFLNRQNRNGQKLVLPIIHNITNDDLRKKYPLVADIQTVDSRKLSCDEIAIMFARQFIKRLKAEG